MAVGYKQIDPASLEKKCIGCGQMFYRRHKHGPGCSYETPARFKIRKYCSSACESKARQIRIRASPLRKNCIVCGKPFLAKTYRANYCSKNCKEMYFTRTAKIKPHILNGKHLSMTRRIVYAFPLQLVYDHPVYKAMNATGQGLIWNLCCRYWLSELEPLPTQNIELYLAMNGSLDQGERYKFKVMKIFNDIKEELDNQFNYRAGNRENLLSQVLKARGRQKALRLERKKAKLVADPLESLKVERLTQSKRSPTSVDGGERKGFSQR